jgi:putative FmdB family regulatory protein
MPLYTYSCRECEHEFEALVFTGDEVECPQCRSRELEQHWGLPARPVSKTTPLPTDCDPSLPPCGPACRRLGG